MKQKLLITALLIITAIAGTNAQNLVINGSFENNKATMDVINPSNQVFDSLMSDVTDYGWWGNADIIESNGYCHYPEDKKWEIDLTGGGSDAIAMTLSSPVVAGQKYVLSYWDAGCDFGLISLEFGISTNDSSFGTKFFQGPLAIQSKWVNHIDTFTANTSGSYLTIEGSNGDIGYWTQLDNVSLTALAKAPNAAFNMPVATCPNQGTTVSVDSSFIESYVWNFGNANVISSTGSGSYQLSWSNPGTYFVSLTVTDSVGSSTVVDSIVVNAAPTANFALDTTIIAGQTDLVNYTGNGQADVSTFNWNLNSAIIENNSGNQCLGVTWGIPGIYNVSLTVTQNGCTSAPIQEVVNVISPLTVATPVCSDSICMISYSQLALNSGVYSWSFPGGNIMAGSGAGPYTLQYITPGKYAVTVNVTLDSMSFTYTDTVNVTNGSSCYNHVIDSITKPSNGTDTTTLTTGIDGVNKKLGITNLYPNPTLSILNVDLGNITPGTVHLEVYDVLGRVVISNYKTVTAENNSIIINTEDLTAGSYFLRVTDNNNYSDAKKFIKLL